MPLTVCWAPMQLSAEQDPAPTVCRVCFRSTSGVIRTAETKATDTLAAVKRRCFPSEHASGITVRCYKPDGVFLVDETCAVSSLRLGEGDYLRCEMGTPDAAAGVGEVAQDLSWQIFATRLALGAAVVALTGLAVLGGGWKSGR